ncbi:MAG: diaminopimelate decarboxylase [Muribaculaceae bacterium]|nr:diaminopimelate decarboxylase [Muribaculaceae bacterium]
MKQHFPVERFESIVTPFYAYDMSLLSSTLEAINEAAPESFFCVEYAIKANHNPDILKAISAAGLGADCVSGGEIRRALECGFDASKITYAGVGKRDDEIRLGIESGIGCFNVESFEEMEVIAAIAAEMGRKAPVAIRVNPDIDAHTHHYITTGLAENKFGIAKELLDKAVDTVLSYPSLELKGLHFHIGSQVLDYEPFGILCRRINDMQDHLESRGVHLQTINVGGGLGIDYDNPDENPIPDFKAYFEMLRSNIRLREGQHLHCELGRSVVAQCGSLIARVLYVKEGIGKKFVICDAGMTDLIRPALYGAHHVIENLTAAADSPTEEYDVVGPVCESSDVFATSERLPLTRRGDLLAFRSAGAYGEVMSSGYNCRVLNPSVEF